MSEINESTNTLPSDQTTNNNNGKGTDVITKEDLKNLLDKVRQQESNKVRAELDKANSEASELRKQLDQVKEELSRKLDAPAPPRKPTPKEDPELYIEELKEQSTRNKTEVAQTLEDFRRELENAKKDYDEKIRNMRREEEQRRLDTLRQNLVKDLLYPEVVKGRNEDEIRQSYEAAKNAESVLLSKLKEDAEVRVREELKAKLPRSLQSQIPSDNTDSSSHKGLTMQERMARVSDPKFLEKFRSQVTNVIG